MTRKTVVNSWKPRLGCLKKLQVLNSFEIKTNTHITVDIEINKTNTHITVDIEINKTNTNIENTSCSCLLHYLQLDDDQRARRELPPAEKHTRHLYLPRVKCFVLQLLAPFLSLNML